MGPLQHALLFAAIFSTVSYGPVAAFVGLKHVTRSGIPSLAGSTSTSTSSSSIFASKDAVADAKLQIKESIANTDRGRSLGTPQRTQVHSLLSNLEAQCPISEPARDARMEGPWIVLYTDAPPPSNGQLGFLNGIAKQVIDLEGGRYRNELYVGGSGVDEDEGAWLTAVLDAKWVEWDGVYLDDSSEGDGISPAKSGNKGDDVDYGATTWKVDFVSITLSLFQIPIFTQQFKAGTARTWKMTYLDDDTRIVRAGKTGREEEDWIFYMRRGAQ